MLVFSYSGVALIVALIGVWTAWRARSWWIERHAPSVTPSPAASALIWATVHTAFGAGVGVTVDASLGDIVGLLGGLTVILNLAWIAVLFGRRSVRNGFFVACVAWVAAVLTALAGVADSPAAAILTSPMAVMSTGLVVWAFVLWQINEPTRYRT